jgi:hypothetical protein
MDEAVATLIGALIGFAGALIALFGQRYFQTRGKLILRTSRWELGPAGNDSTTYKLSIAAFNEMDISTGIRDVQVVFNNPGTLEKEIATTPKDAVDDYRIDALNLPSRNWITKDVRGVIGADLRNQLGDAYDVRVRGFLPTGVKIEHEVCIKGKENEDESHYEQWRGPWYRRALGDN